MLKRGLRRCCCMQVRTLALGSHPSASHAYNQNSYTLC
jgi:hypothetical protein